MLQKRVEQRVDRREQVEGTPFEHLDEFPDVTRVRDQGDVRTPANGQQAERQREDVIQRQGGNAVGVAHIADPPKGGGEPGLCLQDGRHDIAVSQHRALAQARRAPRVLQEGNAVQRHRSRFECELRALGQRALEGGHRPPLAERKLEGRHHLGEMAHRKRDPAAVPGAEQIPHRSEHHVLHGRMRNDFFQRMGKILEYDDGRCTGVLELVFQFTCGVERIDIDAGIAGTQHRGHSDRKLRHIGQHDGHARTRLQAQALQPGAQRRRQLI